MGIRSTATPAPRSMITAGPLRHSRTWNGLPGACLAALTRPQDGSRLPCETREPRSAPAKRRRRRPGVRKTILLRTSARPNRPPNSPESSRSSVRVAPLRRPLSGDWPAVKSTHQIAAIAYDLVVLVSDYTVAKGSDAASSQNDAASPQPSTQQQQQGLPAHHAPARRRLLRPAQSPS